MEHRQHLQAVVQRLADECIVINVEKSVLEDETIQFLHLIITPHCRTTRLSAGSHFETTTLITRRSQLLPCIPSKRSCEEGRVQPSSAEHHPSNANGRTYYREHSASARRRSQTSRFWPTPIRQRSLFTNWRFSDGSRGIAAAEGLHKLAATGVLLQIADHTKGKMACIPAGAVGISDAAAFPEHTGGAAHDHLHGPQTTLFCLSATTGEATARPASSASSRSI